MIRGKKSEVYITLLTLLMSLLRRTALPEEGKSRKVASKGEQRCKVHTIADTLLAIHSFELQSALHDSLKEGNNETNASEGNKSDKYKQQ